MNSRGTVNSAGEAEDEHKEESQDVSFNLGCTDLEAE